ncbi:trypsin epsilon-like isoform X2 [Drosophila novamexicana]|uniref:trypsin epsilon-like isoform X2 n=1 Tax=Drosophila novamexicana TaxID=47314 RepID=UPI0011E5F1AD|nr:trypsin epsilon-like isoform X2 [Drosophila novamexicana]
MGASKFFVYSLLVLLLFVDLSVPGCDQFKFASRGGNCNTLNQRRSPASVNGFSVTPSNRSQVDVRGGEPAPQTLSDNFSQNSSTYDEDNDEFHFLVTGGYRRENDNHHCGGSLISKTVVLTAAHCMFVNHKALSKNDLMVVAGTPRRLLKTSNTQERKVKKIIPHPKYTTHDVHDDIGLIHLKSEMQPDGSFVAIIPIADEDSPAGLECTVIGWGAIFEGGPIPDEAVRGDLIILSDKFCYNLNGFDEGMICASNPADFEVDACQGDSGGPLFSEGKVVGVVSYGNGCGRLNSAGVYADVYYYRKWIERNAATCSLPSWFRLPLITLAMHALRAHCL